MLKRTIRWIMPIVMLLVIATYLLLSTATSSFAAGSTKHTVKQTVTITATETPASFGGVMTPDFRSSH